VEQVLALTPDEASRRYPVLVTGVVTYEDAEWCMLFVQDATAGIYVQCRSHGFPVVVGQRVEVRGVSGAGQFAPVIDAPRLQLLGQGPLPRPKALAFEQLPYPQKDSQWVEIRDRAVRRGWASPAA
jgi:hypothetical protein